MCGKIDVQSKSHRTYRTLTVHYSESNTAKNSKKGKKLVDFPLHWQSLNLVLKNKWSSTTVTLYYPIQTARADAQPCRLFKLLTLN
jgi:hypothetical protein